MASCFIKPVAMKKSSKKIVHDGDKVTLAGASAYDLRRVMWDHPGLPSMLNTVSLSTLALLVSAATEIGCKIDIPNIVDRQTVAARLYEEAQRNGWTQLDKESRLSMASPSEEKACYEQIAKKAPAKKAVKAVESDPRSLSDEQLIAKKAPAKKAVKAVESDPRFFSYEQLIAKKAPAKKAVKAIESDPRPFITRDESIA